MDILGSKQYGDFKISNICYQTYPCKHHVTNEKLGINDEIMSGTKIYELLKKHNCELGHFAKYQEFIRVRYFPTGAERKEKKERIIQQQKRIDKQHQEYLEKQLIINNTKASSRLEKLKERNNKN